MSWQSYVDTNLVGTGVISRAAIIGLQGGIWATSPDLAITPEQEQTLIKAFESGDVSELTASGIKLGDTKFMFLRQNDDSLYGKKGADGVCVTKTTQAILVGEYKEGVQPADANKIVEDLAAYLKGVGF